MERHRRCLILLIRPGSTINMIIPTTTRRKKDTGIITPSIVLSRATCLNAAEATLCVGDLAALERGRPGLHLSFCIVGGVQYSFGLQVNKLAKTLKGIFKLLS